jgi:hypothetical protein
MGTDMKRFTVTLGLLIALVVLKAIVHIARHGTPPTVMPATFGETVGFVYVVVLLVTFVSCLAWYARKK